MDNKLICNQDGIFVVATAIIWAVIYGYAQIAG